MLWALVHQPLQTPSRSFASHLSLCSLASPDRLPSSNSRSLHIALSSKPATRLLEEEPLHRALRFILRLRIKCRTIFLLLSPDLQVQLHLLSPQPPDQQQVLQLYFGQKQLQGSVPLHHQERALYSFRFAISVARTSCCHVGAEGVPEPLLLLGQLVGRTATHKITGGASPQNYPSQHD